MLLYPGWAVFFLPAMDDRMDGSALNSCSDCCSTVSSFMAAAFSLPNNPTEIAGEGECLNYANPDNCSNSKCLTFYCNSLIQSSCSVSFSLLLSSSRSRSTILLLHFSSDTFKDISCLLEADRSLSQLCSQDFLHTSIFPCPELQPLGYHCRDVHNI